MEDDSAKSPDAQSFLQAMYKEEHDQARQHENLRQQSTTIVLTLSGGILALAATTFSSLQRARLAWIYAFYVLLGLFVAGLGWFGRGLSLKHYERNQWHGARARAYRKRLESLFHTTDYGSGLRTGANACHKKKFEEDVGKGAKAIIEAPLYRYWANIYLFVMSIGLLLAALAVAAALASSSLVK
jgi:hypothetical protein